MAARIEVALTALGLGLALGAACGDDGANGGADAVADTLTDADTAPADVDAADGAGDIAADTAPEPDSSPVCYSRVPPVTLPAGQTKVALALFHFNLQYVAGGLEYTDEDGVLQTLADAGELVAGWDNDKVEDWIIRQTFEPILDVYDRHPTWGVDLEMQAYMVEVMAARHPDVLDKLRRLAERGQAEIVSFHYSDQLFLAFPAEDLARSIARTREVFAESCLPLSAVVFNQEGQAGEGRQRMLVAEGYEVGVYPKNLWRYVRGDGAWWPWYESEGGTLIVGPGGVDPESGVDVAWTFFDDGELRAVANYVNPYTAPLGDADPARIAEYEEAVEAQEAAGYSVATIGSYVAQLAALGVEKKPAPPLLDGTWQPPSTDSIHRWLGGRNQVFVGQDEDNRVRTTNARARLHVMAAQVLDEVAGARGVATSAWRADLADAWRELWNAEVSDASGVNPWKGEIRYGLQKSEAAAAHADAVIAAAREALGEAAGDVVVDLKERALVDAATALEPEWVAATPATGAPELAGDNRDASATAAVAGAITRWTLTWSAATPCAEGDDACDARDVSAAFARAGDALAYCPGLIEDEVRSYALSDFTLQKGEAYLPLANGLIGLGGGRWLVKDTRTAHIAARVAPDDDRVRFIDRTIPEGAGASWVFYVVEGTEAEALAWANRVNVHPLVRIGADGALTVGPGAP
ncbi:MAG: hypothetical protein KC635_01485 [Myxococcales bacterium]|nr:hypothetical protein [Myxococcales bacterium]